MNIELMRFSAQELEFVVHMLSAYPNVPNPLKMEVSYYFLVLYEWTNDQFRLASRIHFISNLSTINPDII